MSVFAKPSLSIDEQINQYLARGLMIFDKARAHHYLSNITYYRLSAYTRPFYQPQQTAHSFIAGTTFDDVLTLYVFDRELRLLLLDAIERIEVALRTQLANTLADHHQPHGYLSPLVFDSRYDHSWLLKTLAQPQKGKNKETFLLHYQNNYPNSPAQPPIWMAVECLTFSEVSILFANLRNPKDTQRIEQHFGWKFTVLKSWFRSLSDLRNLCAHHSRVWNREFGSFPELPKRCPQGWPLPPTTLANGIRPQRRVYMQILVLASLMRVVCPESGWAGRLMRLLESYPMVSGLHMGFPDDWQALPFWQKGQNP